jgi:hypothetical protein
MLVIRGKLQSSSERLFTGRNNIENLKNSLLLLNHALRKLNPKVKNAVQIRQSVITEWLKEKDLRTVHGWAPVCKFYVALPDHQPGRSTRSFKQTPSIE